MDFRVSVEEEAFRKGVGEFLGSEIAVDWGKRGDLDTQESKAFRDQFAKKLGFKEWLVGAWSQGIITHLDFERSGIGATVALDHFFKKLVQHVKETKCNGGPLAKDTPIKQKIANVKMELEVAHVLSYRVAWMQSRNMHITHQAS